MKHGSSGDLGPIAPRGDNNTAIGNRPDPQIVESIFNPALERRPEERIPFLDAVCAGNADVRARVLRLLECFDRAADRLDCPPPSLLDEDESQDPEALPGQRIGPYELIRILASGGMGTVWLARRADAQFEKQVAIKLIKRGMDTDALLARFRRERQVLASLEHPNIARLLDGGVTSDGLPYLVMEYVDGPPIDHYCDEHKLTISQRLDLFRSVCMPVQFAHQNLVVHRDLKPGNILIASERGSIHSPSRPSVKLLDFGISKVLHADGSEGTTDHTAADLRIMTPRYASPEQVRGEKITTASDVYSLGVVLYELLTGHEPYELTTRSRPEYERAICEHEPVRPSMAVSRVVAINDTPGRAGAAAASSERVITPQFVSAARCDEPRRLKRRSAETWT